MAKKDPFQELMSNIDWTRWFQVIIPVMQPIVIFGSWLAFAKFDKRADAVSKLIALAEPIPAIDLNVPKPVVLASLFHSTDEALQILGDVIEFLQDIEIPSAGDIIEDIKEEVKEVIPGAKLDYSQQQQLLADHKECKAYADLFPIGGSLAYAGCMIRKGWSSDAWGEL